MMLILIHDPLSSRGDPRRTAGQRRALVIPLASAALPPVLAAAHSAHAASSPPIPIRAEKIKEQKGEERSRRPSSETLTGRCEKNWLTRNVCRVTGQDGKNLALTEFIQFGRPLL